jgi:glycine/D-amino acid oxidase-like deaminating enzyme
MRVCIIGGGLAGTLLAWRLAQTSEVERVDLLLGRHTAQDATEMSGGVVRAYEADPEQRRLAVESLVELLGSTVLQDWSGFRQSTALYIRHGDPGLPTALRQIEAELRGSAQLLSTSELFSLGFQGLPYGTVAVSERLAGYVSPSRLRSAVLSDLVTRPSVTALSVPLDSLMPRVNGTVTAWAGQQRHEYDVAVVAAGAWTPRVLVANGLSPQGYRTKSIQYTVYAAAGWRPPTFVDETSGLYGKPTPDGAMLLGLATREWDVVPGTRPVTAELHGRARELAALRLPRLELGAPLASVNATDCYCPRPVLALRPVPGTAGTVCTFTGGSGGSAKTALAASRRAAERLVHSTHGLTHPRPTSTHRRVNQP